MKQADEDIKFSVDLKVQLSELTFGVSHYISSHTTFKDLEALEKPYFKGQLFFGYNNLQKFDGKNERYSGINCLDDLMDKESKIFDGGTAIITNTNETEYSTEDYTEYSTEYSYACLYAENQYAAEINIYLKPDILEKLFMATNAVSFQLVTSINEHKNIYDAVNKGAEPSNIILDEDSGQLTKFTLDLRKKEFEYLYFRIKLLSLDFMAPESLPGGARHKI
jgi:hypothetical protein